MTTTTTTTNRVLIDPSRFSAVPCLQVEDHEVLATLTLGHLRSIVPDPRSFENKAQRAALAGIDPLKAQLADQRETVQRFFTGAKRSNVGRYSEFMANRTRQGLHRGTPPICLGTTKKLQVVQYDTGMTMIGIPHGMLFLAVDGETQRAAWEEAYQRLYQDVQAGMSEEEALDAIRIPVEIHFDLDLDRLQALFYERNVLGSKVNANEAIAKDQTDPAMQIVRMVMNRPLTLPNGKVEPTLHYVQQSSRQVSRNTPHWVTLSALRTLVVTTMLGRSGLQYGAKPITLDESVPFDEVAPKVAELVHAILERFAWNFRTKDTMLIGAPAMMAGIGVVANRVIPELNVSGRPALTQDELFELLGSINWEKNDSGWEGVGTRRTPKGAITVAGPKEVGYAVADAIEGINPETSSAIRRKTALV